MVKDLLEQELNKKMWIKNDKTCCENCGIHMAAFYEYDAENYLCPECTAEMNEHKEFEECE